MEVCATEHPVVVLDAGYELNGDTGPEEHNITVESEVSGMESKVEAHKETEWGPKHHSGPQEEYRCSNQI